MIERTLRIVATVLSLILVAGFAMFALDEFNRASSKQRNELAGFEQADPTPVGERQRERRHSTAREYIDDANDVLLKPFAGVIDSGSRWAQRGVPTLLGLFVYGFGIAFVARFMKGRG
ncbi:MAG: hypothetical protein QOJ89_2442 [bacterium]